MPGPLARRAYTAGSGAPLPRGVTAVLVGADRSTDEGHP